MTVKYTSNELEYIYKFTNITNIIPVTKGSYNNYILRQACKDNDIEKIKLLILDKTVHTVPSDYHKAMQLAFDLKHKEIFKTLLTFLIHNDKIYNNKESEVNKLILAILDNNYIEVKQLLDHYLSNVTLFVHFMIYAAKYNNSRLMKMLLVKLDYENNASSYALALEYAIKANNIKIVKLLISLVIDIHPFISIAFNKKRHEIFALLISDARFDPNMHKFNNLYTGHYGVPYSILSMAVLNNNIKLVENIVTNNYTAETDDRPIVFAAHHNYIDIYKLLIKHTNINPSSYDNWAIRLAVANNKIDMVDLLLQDPRVDPSAKSNVNIYKAASRNYITITKRLLQDPRVDPSGINNRTIINAFNNGNFEIVRLLMQDHRINLNALYTLEDPALELFINMRVHLEDYSKTCIELKDIYKIIVLAQCKRIIVSRGFPNIPEKLNIKIIFKAMEKHKIYENNIPNLIKVYKIDSLVDLFTFNQNMIITTPKDYLGIRHSDILYISSLLNHTVLMEDCIQNTQCVHSNIGMNCNLCKDWNHGGTLLYCIDHGYTNICYYIIKKYISADFDDNYCLKMAATKNQYKMALFLLDNGADVNARNNESLVIASRNGHLDMVKLLIKYGADVNKTNKKYSALDWAVIENHIEIVKYLVENGADISASCALIYSVKYNHLDILKYLINSGVDLVIEDNHLFEIALMANNFTMLEYLFEFISISPMVMQNALCDCLKKIDFLKK